MTSSMERSDAGDQSVLRSPPHDREEGPLASELRRTVPLVAVMPVFIAVLWGVGMLVTHTGIDDWDVRGERWIADHRVSWLDSATEWGTWLAESLPVITLVLLAIVIARRSTGSWRPSVFIGVSVGCEKLIYLLTSLLVDRGRPPIPTLGDTYATSSFPSGHVASAITLYGSIALVVGAWKGRRHLVPLLTLTALFACIVGFSRMYRGFHFPSDVVAGAALGIVWLSLTHRILRPLHPDDPAPASTAEVTRS